MTDDSSFEHVEPLKLTKVPLYQQAYEALTEMIFRGQFRQGDRVTEKSLSEILGVSGTPIREAMRKLEHDGLLESVGNEVRITSLTLEDITQLYVCRKALETIAVEAAVDALTASDLDDLKQILEGAERAGKESNIPDLVSHNTRFHDRILQAAGNRWLMSAVALLRKPLLLARAQITLDKDEFPRVINDHWEIYRALERRDKAAAVEALTQHMTTDCERMQRSVPKSSDSDHR